MLNNLQKLYKTAESYCNKDYYNLVLHKHLGDVFYAIALKPFFEAQYKAPLHFIVRPQHEFLMKLFDVKNYTVFDMKQFENNIINTNFKYMPFANHKSHRFDMICKDLFPSYPVKNVPFIVDGERNNFCLFKNYWAYLWAENMDLNPNFKFLLPENKLALSEQARRKIKKIASLDKIVLFAPEAATFPEFGPEFWNIIADIVHKKGYKIIVNSKRIKLKHGISAFDLGLSLEDICALGMNCAYVFALRSGLCDVLVGIGEKLYALYPAQGRRELYSLSRPFATKTNVNEIQIHKWKISYFNWEGIDLGKRLQPIINKWHIQYIKEKIKSRSFLYNKGVCRFWYRLFNDLAGTSKVFPENNLANPKEYNIKNVHLGILPIFYKSKQIQEDRIEKITSIFGNFYKIKKNNFGKKNIRILGISVYTRKIKNHHKFVKILGITIHKKDITYKFLDGIIKNLPKKIDDIYLIRHNIGESYIYLAHAIQWVNSNKSKDPVFIAWREKDIEFYKMFLPKNIPVIYIPINQSLLHAIFTQESIKYRGYRFFCNTPDIAQNMLLLHTKNPHINFYNYISKDFKLKGIEPLKPPMVDQKTTLNIQDKIKIYFKRPYVVVMPEATSLTPLSTKFWDKLISHLDKMGYDIFINNHSSEEQNKINLYEHAISFDATIPEMYVLAQKSAGVITLASGLSVLLTSVHVKMDLIYTDFKMKKPHISSTAGKAIYSVYSIPKIDKNLIKEHDIKDFSEESLITKILMRYRWLKDKKL